jgi:hypothetical protein
VKRRKSKFVTSGEIPTLHKVIKKKKKFDGIFTEITKNGEV